MGGSIGHMCCMGGLLDIGVLYGGGSIGHMCCMGVYWT